MESSPPATGKETVIVAFDGSPGSRKALMDAARIIGSCRVLVVTVWEEGLAYAPSATGSVGGVMGEGMMMSPALDVDVAQAADRALHDQAEQVAREGAELAKSLGLDAEALAVPDEDNVSRTILQIAGEQNAGAIVVGSRGLGRIRARLEGSTSKSLLKHAPCPVIVVHEGGTDEA